MDEERTGFAADVPNGGFRTTVLLAGTRNIRLVSDSVLSKVVLHGDVLVAQVIVCFVDANGAPTFVLNAFQKFWKFVGEVRNHDEGNNPFPVAVVVFEDFPVRVAVEGYVFRFVRRDSSPPIWIPSYLFPGSLRLGGTEVFLA